MQDIHSALGRRHFQSLHCFTREPGSMWRQNHVIQAVESVILAGRFLGHDIDACPCNDIQVKGISQIRIAAA